MTRETGTRGVEFEVSMLLVFVCMHTLIVHTVYTMWGINPLTDLEKLKV